MHFFGCFVGSNAEDWSARCGVEVFDQVPVLTGEQVVKVGLRYWGEDGARVGWSFQVVSVSAVGFSQYLLGPFKGGHVATACRIFAEVVYVEMLGWSSVDLEHGVRVQGHSAWFVVSNVGVVNVCSGVAAAVAAVVVVVGAGGKSCSVVLWGADCCSVPSVFAAFAKSLVDGAQAADDLAVGVLVAS